MAPLSVKNFQTQKNSTFSVQKSVQLVNHYKELLEEQKNINRELQEKIE